MVIKAVVWDVDDTIFDYATADAAGMRAHLVGEGLLAAFGTAERALEVWREITVRRWARFRAGDVDFVTQRRDGVRDFLAAARDGVGQAGTIQAGAMQVDAAQAALAQAASMQVGAVGADPVVRAAQADPVVRAAQADPVVRAARAAAALDDVAADAWFGRYLVEYEAAWALFPDAVPALDALAGSHRHAVLSNAAADAQDKKLRALGVRERFEVVLCAAELGVFKPEAGAFLAVCEALRLEPGEVAYVGDQPEIDARGARDAGLLGIWLDRNGDTRATPDGVRRITGLAALPGLLGAVP